MLWFKSFINQSIIWLSWAKMALFWEKICQGILVSKYALRTLSNICDGTVFRITVNHDYKKSCIQDLESTTRGVLQKKRVLKDFSKLTEKRLCQSVFFNIIAVLRPVTLLEKRVQLRLFYLWILRNFLELLFYRTFPGNSLWGF